jgi:hypothetical protein
MNLKEIKKSLSITDADIAENFGYKNQMSYANSSAKKRIESGIEWMYKLTNKEENV